MNEGDAARDRIEALKHAARARSLTTHQPPPVPAMTPPQPLTMSMRMQVPPTWASAHPIAVAAEPVVPPAAVVAELVGLVSANAPVVASRIGDATAARLGRVAAPPDVRPDGEPAGDVMLAERLLGALEAVLDGLVLHVPAALAAHFAVAPRDGCYATAESMGEAETVRAQRRIAQFAPDLLPATAGLIDALVSVPELVPMLQAPAGSELDVAAAHGRAHMALATVTALAVLRAAGDPMVGHAPPAVVALAWAPVIEALRSLPLPPTYAPALQERRRAEYLMPRRSHATVAARHHRIAMVEGSFPALVGEPANGLVEAVPGGLVVRTGTESGSVSVEVHVDHEAPGEVEYEGWNWSDVIDISFTADAGSAALLGVGHQYPHETRTPPWPGPMRARVHARGRDGDERGGAEHYEIHVWEAPLAPQVVHRAADRLGHRLRGEPEPPVTVRPEHAYRWLDDTVLSVAATVTVVGGATVDEVLAAFGADLTTRQPFEQLLRQYDLPYWVAVLPVDGAVVAVEPNGYRGASAAVLRLASARGVAASMYWNVNALSRLSFARDGELLAAFEPGLEPLPTHTSLQPVLSDLDFVSFGDKQGKGLVAVERFTGYAVQPIDLHRIEAGPAYVLRE